ncbi:malonic semialdehyde reductase [Legionella fallonii]|uniref:Putative NADH dehydrogenase/NAD(P)H nitroreductase LFA_3200 n=1 Tax=Legionella fallonii LLAP-10 TaxID=1212491 RepID=A0A098G998_9GAMM|nr:malonic semialdehyde reductase [Legionella fallonii]CEG58536.1 oxidoreductase subunit of the alternative pyrimidine degradation pathway [Legionella fallonii LLAP-10]
MSKVSNDVLNKLFFEARTVNDWLPKEVSDHDLEDIYNLMKWGPTSANLSPARIVFVKKGLHREKLIDCLSPGNIEKVKAAPVTVIIAQDMMFYEKIDKLFPHALGFRDMFASNKEFADLTALRNSSLQGAYFILAARTLGFDCGPMSGFNNQKLDEQFFSGTTWKSNFICNLGYGNKENLHPRLPRLSFEEACKIV